MNAMTKPKVKVKWEVFEVYSGKAITQTLTDDNGNVRHFRGECEAALETAMLNLDAVATGSKLRFMFRRAEA